MNVLTEGDAFHLSPVVMGDIYPNVEDAKIILCATVVAHVFINYAHHVSHFTETNSNIFPSLLLSKII